METPDVIRSLEHILNLAKSHDIASANYEGAVRVITALVAANGGEIPGDIWDEVQQTEDALRFAVHSTGDGVRVTIPRVRVAS